MVRDVYERAAWLGELFADNDPQGEETDNGFVWRNDDLASCALCRSFCIGFCNLQMSFDQLWKLNYIYILRTFAKIINSIIMLSYN